MAPSHGHEQPMNTVQGYNGFLGYISKIEPVFEDTLKESLIKSYQKEVPSSVFYYDFEENIGIEQSLTLKAKFQSWINNFFGTTKIYGVFHGSKSTTSKNYII